LEIKDLVPLSDYLWEVPQAFRSDMRAPARLYAAASQLDGILADNSLEQLVNVATLPGIHPYALAMPDIHQGYGFPIGGVAPILTEGGVISPGGVGYDINCGVRLLCSNMVTDEIRPKLKELATAVEARVPSGVGRGDGYPLTEKDLEEVLKVGCKWARGRGLAFEEDLECTEEGGSYHHADPDCVSAAAKERGRGQLGTMGSGNHFVEIQTVEKTYDAATAAAFGLFEGQVTVLVHTGSRGLGHQICTDYVRLMNSKLSQYDFVLPDRELACAPFRSVEGQQYFAAMAAAANFAWTNRQVITAAVRSIFKEFFPHSPNAYLKLLYDVSHNIAKLERHKSRDYIVHRKGATRAFGPGSPEIPERYRETGQPVLIPGSMGTCSYVLAGTTRGMGDSFGSTCHGAGRIMSRTKAAKGIEYDKLMQQLHSYGVTVRAGSRKGLLEEAPQAYKDVEAVVGVVSAGHLANIVARLRPLAVVKG
jgi:tRNA-splicing ligase RtcB